MGVTVPLQAWVGVIDNLDRIVAADMTFSGISHGVGLGFEYDLMGNRKQVAANQSEGSNITHDFITSYQFDALNRLSLIQQQGHAGGGNPIADKRVSVKYDLAGQLSSIRRYAGLLGTDPYVAHSSFDFDKAGRVTSLQHEHGSLLASYVWEWDKANRIEEFISSQDGIAEYAYDAAGQLEEAVYTDYAAFQLNEEYAYDESGNRIATNHYNQLDYTAYWPASEDLGTTVGDVSDNNLDLSFGGSASWDMSDFAPIFADGASVRFDANGEYLSITNATSLQVGTSDFSAFLWVKLDSNVQDMMFFAHGNPKIEGGKGIEFIYRPGAIHKPLILRINDGVNGSQAQEVKFLTQGMLQDDDWHHLGFSIDRDGLAVIYVDGHAVKAADSAKNGNINPTTPFYVGRANSGASTANIRGRVDDLRVYHHTMGPANMLNQFRGIDCDSSTEYEIGKANQLLSDGTYSYLYDDEGNREVRTLLAGVDEDVYTWDHRNRLTKVERTGSREVVQIDFENGSAEVIVDALGHATNGFAGNETGVTTGEDDVPNESDTTVAVFAGTTGFLNMGIQDWFKPTTHGLTLSAWVYPESTSGVTTILGFGDASTGETGYSLTFEPTYNPGTGVVGRFVFAINNGTSTSKSVTYGPSSSLLGGWHHIAVTMDPQLDEIALYLDGVDVASDVLAGEHLNWSDVLAPFVMGGQSGTATGFFKGRLDDIRVAPYALSADDLEYMMDHADPAEVNTLTVAYTYDHQNRLISRVADLDGEAGPQDATSEFFIHDGTGQGTTSANLNSDNLQQVGQMVLRLNADGEVLDRYLWGPGVDQLLAQEPSISVDGGTVGDVDNVLWALTDHLGTVRDLVRYDSGANEVETVVHRTYDAFGNVTSESSPGAVDVLFGFTGRMYDQVTGLQNNLNRWYDAKVGRWISEDPIGFAGGDGNLYRYVNNQTTVLIDSIGLQGSQNTARYRWKGQDDKKEYNPIEFDVEVALGGGGVTVIATWMYDNDETDQTYNSGKNAEIYLCDSNGDPADRGTPPIEGQDEKDRRTLTWTTETSTGLPHVKILYGPEKPLDGVDVSWTEDDFGNVSRVKLKVDGRNMNRTHRVEEIK